MTRKCHVRFGGGPTEKCSANTGYVKHRMRGFFDLLIGDEIHEFESRGSGLGIAAYIVADVCGKVPQPDWYLVAD